MFVRAGGRYCVPSRADRDLDLGESRARGSSGLFLALIFWWALDWIGSATNRLLKPPNHAAISHAFEAVQRGAINLTAVVQHWRHPVHGRVLPQSRVVVRQAGQEGQCGLRLCSACPAFLG